MSKIDLHCHSIHSDGTLTPEELILRAKQFGVEVLALTDHDSVNGLSEAGKIAEQQQIRLIKGVEISATWNNLTIHITGLNIDDSNLELLKLLERLQLTRQLRGEEIGRKLEKNGIENAYAGACELAKGGLLTRSHYGKFLHQSGYVKTEKDAFKKFLANGKVGFVKVDWATLEVVVNIIHAAGGVACIAHPKRYKMTNTKLNCLFKDFAKYGGDAIEVVNTSSSPSDIKYLSSCALQYGFSASLGSDFHNPNQWVELGKLAPIPKINRVVYEGF